MKKRLLVTRCMPERVMAATREFFDVTHCDVDAPLSPEQISDALAEFDALLPTLGDPLGAEAYRSIPKLRTKIIANFGVGVNHIDVAAANQAGIVVCNTPGAVTDATADIAMMLVLMAARRASEGEMLVRSGAWAGWNPTQLLGMHLGGKTLGVVGMGRIGKAVARRAHLGCGMEVIFFNRSPVIDLPVPSQQMPDIHTLAQQADVVVVAVPGGNATHHLIGPDFFAAMGTQALLVNIARGDVVDEQAMIKALKSGSIAGAGLDVYEQEPVVPKELRDMPNVSLLPHLGTSALEVREAMGLMAVENLNAWANGKVPPNVV